MTTPGDTTPSSAKRNPFRQLTFRGTGLLLLLVTASALRFTGLESRSFFNDELSVMYRLAGESTFRELIREGVVPDFHPAGVQVFLWWWSTYAGDSQFLLRIPFALAGVAGVWLMYLLASRWFGRTSGWLAAASLALLQFPLAYSQMIRPYSTGMVWILAAALLWDRIIFSRNDTEKRTLWLNAAGLAAAFAMAMYNHYYSFLVAGMIGITGLFFLKKHNTLPYLTAGTVALLLFMPHIGVSVEQLSRGGLASWLPPPQPSWIPNHLLYLFNGSGVIALALVVPAAIMIRNKIKRGVGRRTRRRWVIACLWYILPLLFGYFYSVMVNPILQHSVMLFSFPFLLAALFAGFNNNSRFLTKTYSLALPLVLLLNLLFITRYYASVPYTNFREVAGIVCRHTAEGAAWSTDVNHPWYAHYYLDRECSTDSALFYRFPDHAALPWLDSLLGASARNSILYTRLRPADPMALTLIRRHFPYMAACYDDYPWSESYLFSRVPVQHRLSGYPRDTLLLTEVTFDSDNGRRMPSEEEYLHLFDEVLPGTGKNRRNLLIHCEVDLVPGESLPEDLTLVVHSVLPDGTPGAWHGIKLRLTASSHGTAFYTVELPHNTRMRWPLKVYLWNPGKESYRIAAARVSWLRETGER